MQIAALRTSRGIRHLDQTSKLLKFLYFFHSAGMEARALVVVGKHHYELSYTPDPSDADLLGKRRVFLSSQSKILNGL